MTKCFQAINRFFVKYPVGVPVGVLFLLELFSDYCYNNWYNRFSIGFCSICNGICYRTCTWCFCREYNRCSE